MFTGIIQKVASVTDVAAVGPSSQSLKLRLASGYTDLELGESIAVNGVCLTVAEFSPEGEAAFFVSPETLQRTNLGQLKSRSLVNLERALTLSTRLSGHLVQGHVDGQARILEITPQDGGSHVLRFELLDELARYCVEKGSIALNGTSLTLNSVERDPEFPGFAKFCITLIPHTWENTGFQDSRPGDWVNVEIDIMAKYVERLCKPYQKPSNS